MHENVPNVEGQTTIIAEGGSLPVDPVNRLQIFDSLFLEEAQKAATQTGLPLKEILAGTRTGTLISIAQHAEGIDDDEILFPRLPFYELETDTGVLKIVTIDRLVIQSPGLPEGHEPVQLSIIEWIIMEDLARHRGMIRTRAQAKVELYNRTHESCYSAESKSRSFDVHLRNLRVKIGDLNRQIVVAQRGFGYRLSDGQLWHPNSIGVYALEQI